MWIRRLREWVRLLRSVLVSLEDDTKIVMEETMTEWRDRKRGMDAGSAAAGGMSNSGGSVTIPLGPGEWDEGLGIPMCVVCQGVCMPCIKTRGAESVVANYYLQADKIEKLEKDHGWHEEQFDFILQFLRTILLKREFQLSVFALMFISF
jgi:dynein light intermediate chain 1